MAWSQKFFVEVIADVAIGAPLVGAVERSLPPLAVPTLSETALLNVGVTLMVAPKSGVVVDAVIVAATWDTTLRVSVVGWLLPPVLLAVTL